MGILRLLQLPEAQQIKDLDNLTTVGVHRCILDNKKFLKRLYSEFYGHLVEAVPFLSDKIVVEIGTGGGFLKSVMPQVITSDISCIPGVDLCFSAESMPFKENAVDVFYMLNVFHHIKDPRLFLSEASRCLKPGGKIVMIEPANTPWGRFIYQNFHHEKFDTGSGWSIDGAGPLSSSNSAMPYIIFIRDRKLFESRFPALRVQKLYFHTPFSYLISGGFSMRQLLPGFLFKVVRGIEFVLSPLSKYLGMFMTIEIEKTTETTFKDKAQI